MPEPIVHEIEPGVFQIDQHFQGARGVIASYLLADEGGGDLALIEAGPSSTTPTLLAGIRAAGFAPERITKLLVTHIHLDHAGAAGALLERHLPEATLYVHPFGAPHLIDPSKLIASATRIYGDAMERLWGEIVPVPGDRLVVLDDGQEIRAGGRTLRAIETPGHAAHHHAFHDPARGVVFTGDVAAVRLGGSSWVCPPTPPPELDLEKWMQSVARLRALRPSRLALTHFGAYGDVDRHLDRLIARLHEWSGRVEAQLEASTDAAEIAASLERRGSAEIVEAGGTEELAAFYALATPYRMSVDGFARYFRKRAERRAAAAAG